MREILKGDEFILKGQDRGRKRKMEKEGKRERRRVIERKTSGREGRKRETVKGARGSIRRNGKEEEEKRKR